MTAMTLRERRARAELAGEMFRGGASRREIAEQLGLKIDSIGRTLRAVGALPPMGKGPKQKRVCSDGMEKLLKAPPVIERDPCPRCGVRRDIGCNHRPVASLACGLFAVGAA
jgi:hypothetical protein